MLTWQTTQTEKEIGANIWRILSVCRSARAHITYPHQKYNIHGRGEIIHGFET